MSRGTGKRALFERIAAVRRRLDGGVLHWRPDRLAARRNGADEQRELRQRDGTEGAMTATALLRASEGAASRSHGLW